MKENATAVNMGQDFNRQGAEWLSFKMTLHTIPFMQPLLVKEKAFYGDLLFYP